MRKKLFHHDKPEIANDIIFSQGLVTGSDIYLFVQYHIFYDFAKHEANALFYPESQSKFYPDNLIGDNGIDNIIATIRFVQYINVNEPVNIRTFRSFIENRIDNFVLYIFWIICTGKIYQMC